MAERRHSWFGVAVCLALFLLVVGADLSGSGSVTTRAQEAEVDSAAATPVAVAPEPTADPTVTPEPTLAEPVVALVVERAAAAFGVVVGTGEIDPAVAGVTSSVDESGAYYVKRGAIRVAVTSDGPWSGSCHAGESGGSTPTVRVVDGRLEWRLAGTEAWTPFATHPVDPAAGACFPERSVGITSYSYDLRLRVERTDPPGTFAAAITFVVTPAT
ncbi:MAG: hypothetical protein ACRDJH_11595 [Thermomicrobiales bacterium]